jgi:16S rRNA C967 or C1407 C5-methylase (RsmB/RsmF family)
MHPHCLRLLIYQRAHTFALSLFLSFLSSRLGLHRLQLQIAVRGVQMLRPGGVLAYSTCSFNPIENEAVVAALLRTFKGELELVDASDKLVSSA